MQEKNKKTLKLFFAITLLILTLFSLAFEALESHHECNHEDCQICFVLTITRQNIKSLHLAFFSAGFILLIHQKIKKLVQSHLDEFYISDSLILKKIRLNN